MAVAEHLQARQRFRRECSSMSRRSAISEALAAPAPTPASELAPEQVDAAQGGAARNFTARRLEGFTEAARMVKRPTIRLKPSECSIWPGNARDYALLTEDRVRSLIDSIQDRKSTRLNSSHVRISYAGF